MAELKRHMDVPQGAGFGKHILTRSHTKSCSLERRGQACSALSPFLSPKSSASVPESFGSVFGA